MFHKAVIYWYESMLLLHEVQLVGVHPSWPWKALRSNDRITDFVQYWYKKVDKMCWKNEFGGGHVCCEPPRPVMGKSGGGGGGSFCCLVILLYI